MIDSIQFEIQFDLESNSEYLHRLLFFLSGAFMDNTDVAIDYQCSFDMNMLSNGVASIGLVKQSLGFCTPSIWYNFIGLFG